MQAKVGRERDIEQYLEEGLLALVPFYEGDAGRTMVHTLQGEHRDRRGTGWLVQRLASYYHLDLGELRRRCGRLLDQRHHITLPLTSALVLLPVRARRSAALGETTMGYISLLQVEKILPAPEACGAVHETGAGVKTGSHLTRSGETAPPHFLSLILFKNGLQLASFNTPETLEERMRQGHRLRREAAERKAGAQFIGMGADDLAELLPPCECVLKEIFVRIITGNKG